MASRSPWLSKREGARSLTGRRTRVWQKAERWHASDEMAAGLSSLSDQTIGAPTDCLSCLRVGTDHHKDEDSRLT